MVTLTFCMAPWACPSGQGHPIRSASDMRKGDCSYGWLRCAANSYTRQLSSFLVQWWLKSRSQNRCRLRAYREDDYASMGPAFVKLFAKYRLGSGLCRAAVASCAMRHIHPILELVSALRQRSEDLLVFFCFLFLILHHCAHLNSANMPHRPTDSMASTTPLMKNEPRASDDDYSDAGHHHGLRDLRQRRALLCKENLGWALLCALLVGLTVGVSAGVAALVVLKWQSEGPSCLSQTSSASPITRDLDITYHVETFNGSFMNENIYRQKGSPEVDAAWEALGINCKFKFL